MNLNDKLQKDNEDLKKNIEEIKVESNKKIDNIIKRYYDFKRKFTKG